MKRKAFVFRAARVFVLAGCAMGPATAKAQAGVTVTEVIGAPTLEGAISAHIEATVAGFGEQLTELGTLITNIKLVVSGVNEVAAMTRKAFEAYEFLRKLDRAYLLEHAKQGMYAAMPELRDIEREVRLTIRQKKALEEGDFLAHRNYHDARTGALLSAAASAAYSASVYPILFPESKKYREIVTESEKLLAYRWRRLGLARDQAVKTAAKTTMAGHVKNATENAEKKGRIDLDLEALQTKGAFGTMTNTQELADIEKSKVSEQEAARLRRLERQRSLQRALDKHADDLGRVGVVK